MTDPWKVGFASVILGFWVYVIWACYSGRQDAGEEDAVEEVTGKVVVTLQNNEKHYVVLEVNQGDNQVYRLRPSPFEKAHYSLLEGGREVRGEAVDRDGEKEIVIHEVR